MPKKVCANSQISLGVKPTKSHGNWQPPGGYTTCNQWALDNRDALITYADRIEEHGTAAEQLHEFLTTAPGQ